MVWTHPTTPIAASKAASLSLSCSPVATQLTCPPQSTSWCCALLLPFKSLLWLSSPTGTDMTFQTHKHVSFHSEKTGISESRPLPHTASTLEPPALGALGWSCPATVASICANPWWRCCGVVLKSVIGQRDPGEEPARLEKNINCQLGSQSGFVVVCL